MSNQYGKLYVVATPIGNLADFSFRAVEILKNVDLIAAEDTRHVKALLNHYGIGNKIQSLHQHNEDKVSARFIDLLCAGQSIALVSYAGTPLLCDPGMPLVQMAKATGIDVVPIPGACALLAALSASGLAITRFSFEGFLPRTSSARKSFFQARLNDLQTWAFYESSHRILATFQDMAEVLPVTRQVVIARELTKLHETIVKDSLQNQLERLEQDMNMRKGEFVVIVDGAQVDKKNKEVSDEQLHLLTVLLKQCSVKTAVALAVEITGESKKKLYQAALMIERTG